MVLKRDERDFNKRPEPLQYETSRTFSSLFFFFLFQTDYFHSGKNKKKNLGTHLSSCVIKQREGANYE